MRHLADVEAIDTYEGTETSRRCSSGATSPVSAPSPDLLHDLPQHES
ncbi:MAG: hypothetical protein JWO60_1548 [Frankiales bacterium]|nr:hypothetical protein [Frankiales bacterium]